MLPLNHRLRPFNGANTTCYLSQVFIFLPLLIVTDHWDAQYTNAIYVIGADSSNPSTVYIFDATAKSWSAQSVVTGKLDPASFDAILDHDTNVFCTLLCFVVFFFWH